jgi:predicted sugar kinase
MKFCSGWIKNIVKIVSKYGFLILQTCFIPIIYDMYKKQKRRSIS